MLIGSMLRMLGRLFGKRESAAPEPGPQLCMPTLASAKGLGAASIESAWKELFPKNELKVSSREKQSATFECDGQAVAMVAIPAPVPQPDIEFACSRSWMWSESAEAMKRQRCHLVVAAAPSNERSPIREALAVSRLVCAVGRAGDPVGIYWGNGGQVHNPEFFIDAVTTFDEDDVLPCMLWIGQSISAREPEGPFTLSTMGMNAFGHKEFEIIDTHMPVGDLRTTMYDTINYLLSAGPIFKHGQTFGPTAQDKWKIEHTKSKFRDGEHVIRLHIP